MRDITTRLKKLERRGTGFHSDAVAILLRRDGQVTTTTTLHHENPNRSKTQTFTGDTFDKVSNTVSDWWAKHGANGIVIRVGTRSRGRSRISG